jgi:hypothetical protein
MTNYTDYLEDTVWCNDRSIYSGKGYGTNSTSYSAENRINENKTPSLACVNDNDRFTVSSSNGNGDLDYPVALLTADELSYAGVALETSNLTNYLYTGQTWWTLSPDHFGGSYGLVWTISTSQFFHGTSNYAFYSQGVRPAISLKPGTTYTSGDGSTSSPYIVE